MERMSALRELMEPQPAIWDDIGLITPISAPVSALGLGAVNGVISKHFSCAARVFFDSGMLFLITKD
jgi:hypothetical protein